MSKALVIKNADYSANALDHIDFSGVPCTGISLNKEVANLASIGATETLVATVAPLNTTDAIRWTSSAPEVVLVNNGLITSVAVGTATITATCGLYSASCVVHSSVSYNANNKLYTNGYEFTTTNMNADPPVDYIGLYGTNVSRIYGDSENTLNGYKAYHVKSSLGINEYPLPIPAGTEKISFSFPAEFTRIYVGLLSATQLPTNPNTSYGCARVLYYTDGQGVSNGTYELTLPDVGADSFVFSLKRSSGAASDVTGDVIITLS